jgi:glycosyltransferase involved in cell wall biosynthesis
MRLCWLVPDDRGGGVISVALSCVRQARAAGHDAVLLLMLEPTGWLNDVAGIRTASLGLKAPAQETPRALLRWLEENPQDILLLNGGEQANPIIPYLPAGIRCLYVVHDTAPRYWQPALAAELDLHAIVAVSHTVAGKFVHLLKAPEKLSVIHNGSVFPPPPDLVTARLDDILFLGGSNPTKGARDVLNLWPRLLECGFTGRLHWFGYLDPDFERQVAQLPDSERILRPGRTQRDVIFAAAATAKVLLMLSRVEPFGMATIEGMSMGCVPVAWDIPTGTKEIVTDETGFFVPLGDSTALTRQVMRVCAEHAHFAPLVARRARDNFDEAVMWRGYAKCLDELMQVSPKPHSRTGEAPPDFIPPRRFFQILPASLRVAVRNFIGRSPRLGYWLRDLRGR